MPPRPLLHHPWCTLKENVSPAKHDTGIATVLARIYTPPVGGQSSYTRFLPTCIYTLTILLVLDNTCITHCATVVTVKLLLWYITKGKVHSYLLRQTAEISCPEIYEWIIHDCVY